MDEVSVDIIINKLSLVIEGKLTKEEVSDWASTYVMQDDPTIDDEKTWDLLTIVSGIDIKVSPTEYLYKNIDIKDWINEFSK